MNRNVIHWMGLCAVAAGAASAVAEPWRVVGHPDLKQALEKAPQIHPCLLLLDYRLPGLNGVELYDRLQQKEETSGVPAIMMSATLPVAELQRRGIHQLRKPKDIGGVIRMITHALATSEEQHLYQQKQYH